MKIGAAGNLPWFGAPVVEVARAAESLGFESLWMGEHIILPVDIKKPERHGVPVPPNYRHMPDPLIWLTAAATVTSTLRLGTQICLVPQRNPLILAKEIASLDHISGGRVILGAGTGWIAEEAAIMGVPPGSRWAKTMEHLRALKTLWTEETPCFEGEFVSFPPLYSYPKPVQQPHPPILIGAGSSEVKNRAPVLKRVVEVADGWLPAFLTPAEIKQDLKELSDRCSESGRDFDELDITLLVPAVNLGVGAAFATMGADDEKGTLDRTSRDPGELLAEYEEAGVKRVIVGLVDMTADSGLRVLEDAATGLGLC